MRPAQPVLRRWFSWAVLLLGAGSFPLWAAPPKSAPTRPSPPSSLARAKVDRSDEYVDLLDVARRFGLKPQWLKPGKRIVLSQGTLQFEFEADSREIEARGVRVFLGQPVRATRSGLTVGRIDAETLLPALIRPGYGEKKVPDGKIIVIDPGHGGPDQGTQNTKLALREKVLTLDVSLRLKKVLEAAGYKVLLTRSTDKQLLANKRADLQERAAIANRAGADLFISIHFNSVPNDTRTNGAEIYTFTPQYQRSTDSWSRAGADDTEKDASPINAYDHWNAYLANAIHRRVLSGLKVDDRGQKLAHFGVLRQLKCPGVLVEAGFLSNQSEARQIATPAYRQRIADSIAAGIRDYTTTLASLRAR